MSKGSERSKQDPEHPGHREHPPKTRKDTRQWCRGKVGVAHTPAITPGKYNQHCGRMPDWMRRVRARRREVIQLDWYCKHQSACARCGKVLEWAIPPTDCPDLPNELAMEVQRG